MPTPSAGTATVDLTASGNFGFVGDGVFLTGQLQPAGTGNFNSFVQIQNAGVEQGYNTDFVPRSARLSTQATPPTTTIRFCWPRSRSS